MLPDLSTLRDGICREFSSFLQLLAQVRSDALQPLVYRPLRNAQPLRNRPLGETFQQMPRGDLPVGWTEALQRLLQSAGKYARIERLLRSRVFVFYRFACLFVAGRVALALRGRPNAVAEAFQVLPNHAHTPLIPITWSEFTNRVYSCLPYTQEDYLCADENS